MVFPHFLIFMLSLLKYTTCVLSFNIEKCKMNDERCILKVANKILHENFTGNSNMSLQSIDPLQAEVMKFIQETGPVEIDATLTNISIRGFSNGNFYKFVGFENNKLEIGLKTPTGIFYGQYKLIGRILIIPVTGEGTTTTSFNDLDMIMTLPMMNTTRNGKTFYKIMNPKMTFDMTGGETSLSHLSSFANAFINWSFNIVINAIKSSVSKPLVEVFAAKMNEVFDHVPIEDLFI